MFKIVPAPTFTCPVRLSVPGSEVPAALTITFRHKGQRELAAWLASAAQRDNDTDFLAEVIESWRDIVGEDGKPVPYSTEALTQLLQAYPAAGQELVLAYRHQLADARAKN